MSAPARPGGSTVAPAATAAVLAVLTALLAVLLVHVLSVRDDNSRDRGRLAAPTADQQRAVQSAAIEAANLLTLSRKSYDSDYARALAGVTGSLRSQIAARKSDYLSAMTAGKFDLKASVAQSAFVAQSGKDVVALVTLNGAHVVDGVSNQVATPQRVRLTMVEQDGKWLASSFQAVGVQ